MSDDNPEDLKKKLDSLKPKKKKKLTVPEGFLDEAKSYEGKLMAVRIISEREKDRVVLMFKKMIAQGLEDAVRIEKEREAAKRAEEDRAAAEKKAKLAAEQKAKKSLFGRKK